MQLACKASVQGRVAFSLRMWVYESSKLRVWGFELDGLGLRALGRIIKVSGSTATYIGLHLF